MALHSINNGGQEAQHITPEDLTNQICQTCGNDTFIQAFKLGTLSKLHPANKSNPPQDMHVNYPVFVCLSCHEVMK